MNIGAADPERTDAGPPGRRSFRPWCQTRGDLEGATVKVDRRIDGAELGQRRDFALAQHQRCLDEAGDARRHIQMADIAFGGPDNAAMLAIRSAKRGGKAKKLYRIAERRRGAVAFHIADRRRIDAGIPMRGLDNSRLTLRARSGIAHLGGAIIIDAAAANDCMDVIAVGECIVEPLEQHAARATPEHRAARRSVEGPADPIAGHHAAGLVDIAALLRHRDGNAAGKRHVGLAGKQTLTGLRHAKQRCRAGREHGNCRAAQIELVRYACRQRVGNSAEEGWIAADLIVRREFLNPVALREDIVQQIGVEGRARENADCSLVARRIIAGVFERFPGDFQENALLRIDQSGIAWLDAEESGVKEIDIFQMRSARNIVGRPPRLLFKRIFQLVRRE